MSMSSDDLYEASDDLYEAAKAIAHEFLRLQGLPFAGSPAWPDAHQVGATTMHFGRSHSASAYVPSKSKAPGHDDARFHAAQQDPVSQTQRSELLGRCGDTLPNIHERKSLEDVIISPALPAESNSPSPIAPLEPWQNEEYYANLAITRELNSPSPIAPLEPWRNEEYYAKLGSTPSSEDVASTCTIGHTITSRYSPAKREDGLKCGIDFRHPSSTRNTTCVTGSYLRTPEKATGDSTGYGSSSNCSLSVPLGVYECDREGGFQWIRAHANGTAQRKRKRKAASDL